MSLRAIGQIHIDGPIYEFTMNMLSMVQCFLSLCKRFFFFTHVNS